MINKESDEYLKLHPSEKPKGYTPKTMFEGVKPLDTEQDLISKQARIQRLQRMRGLDKVKKMTYQEKMKLMGKSKKIKK